MRKDSLDTPNVINVSKLGFVKTVPKIVKGSKGVLKGSKRGLSEYEGFLRISLGLKGSNRDLKESKWI